MQKILLSCFLCLFLISSTILPFQGVSAVLCPPRPEPPTTCSHGACFTPSILLNYPIPSNMSVSISTKFTAENSTIKDLNLRIYDANTNKTIPHDTVLIIISIFDHTVLHDLFHTDSGELALKIISVNTTGNWVIQGYQETRLNAWENKTGGSIPVQTSISKIGLYYVGADVLGICDNSDLLDTLKELPHFNSWWFIDSSGNVVKFNLSKSWIKNTYEWWMFGKISDNEFNSEIQYLIDKKMNDDTIVSEPPIVIMGTDASTSSANYNSTKIVKIQNLIDSCTNSKIGLLYGSGSETITLNKIENNCRVLISGEIEMGQFNNQCSVPLVAMRSWTNWHGDDPGGVGGISGYCQKGSIINP